MNRKELAHEFSKRLVSALHQNGQSSSRSHSKVRIDNLAEIAGCSLQMARRYISGDGIPDIESAVKIAEWLRVSAGWLFFGDEVDVRRLTDETIIIDNDVLYYILTRSARLFTQNIHSEIIVSYVMDIILDISKIKADKVEIYKIVDHSVNSILKFHGVINGNKNVSGEK